MIYKLVTPTLYPSWEKIICRLVITFILHKCLPYSQVCISRPFETQELSENTALNLYMGFEYKLQNFHLISIIRI